MKKTKQVIFTLLTVACMLVSVSCSASDGKGRLAETLYADYVADISFSMSENGQILEGRATVSKDDKTVITFVSPDAFQGLSVESDENGESGILQFSYYGMRLPLPDGALGKINLLLSAFSREMTGNIVSVPQKSITSHNEISENNTEKTLQSSLKEMSFVHHDGKTRCMLVYDALNGYPVSLEMDDGAKNIVIGFDKIKITS